MPFHRICAAVALAALVGADASAAAPQTAIFAGGCFWSAEHALEDAPGVVSVVSGYAGGAAPSPTYDNHPGYLEAVKVTFDPARISYAALVSRYFNNIDPTDAGGQICDRGPSYRTAIFVAGEAQRQAALAGKAAVQQALRKPVATQVLRAQRFWPAEAYHQDFARRNPARYAAYKLGCGRDARLKAVWGAVRS